jgi:hypothetical protein
LVDHDQKTWTLHPEAMPIEGANGKVQVAAERDGTHDVRLQVDHLKPAGIAFEGTKAYVVWLRPPDGALRKVGVLPVDGNQKGELVTRTPYRSFELLVTAEPSLQTAKPAGSEVMETRVTLAA